MVHMETLPKKWAQLLQALRERADESDGLVIVDARLAIEPDGIYVIDLQPTKSLQTIPF